MADELISYLMDEIAMDCEEGTPVAQLPELIEKFYTKQSQSQNIDLMFLAFVLDNVRSCREVFLKIQDGFMKNETVDEMSSTEIIINGCKDNTLDIRMVLNRNSFYIRLLGTKNFGSSEKAWNVFKAIAKTREHGFLASINSKRSEEKDFNDYYIKLFQELDLIVSIPYVSGNGQKARLVINKQYISESCAYQEFLQTDKSTVKSLIKKVLMYRPSFTCLQEEVLNTLGYKKSTHARKIAMRILLSMHNESTIERVYEKANESDPCPSVFIRLKASFDRANNHGYLQPFGNVCIENQIVDQMWRAGHVGLSITELSQRHLGNMKNIVVKTILNRIKDQEMPTNFTNDKIVEWNKMYFNIIGFFELQKYYYGIECGESVWIISQDPVGLFGQLEQADEFEFKLCLSFPTMYYYYTQAEFDAQMLYVYRDFEIHKEWEEKVVNELLADAGKNGRGRPPLKVKQEQEQTQEKQQQQQQDEQEYKRRRKYYQENKAKIQLGARRRREQLHDIYNSRIQSYYKNKFGPQK